MENIEIKLVPANMLKRLANYIVDLIVFSFLLSIVLKIIAPVYPLMDTIMQQKPISLVERLTIGFLFGLYISVVESLLKGKSFGKYLTGTRAVSIDGQPITAQTAFMRGLIRIVPFEQLSGLLFPLMWHDLWSKSMVIDEAQSQLPRK